MVAMPVVESLPVVSLSRIESIPSYCTSGAPDVGNVLIPSYGDVVAASHTPRPSHAQHTYFQQGISLKLSSQSATAEDIPLIYSGTEVSGEVTWTESDLPRQLTITLIAHAEPNIGQSHSGQDPSDEGDMRYKVFWSNTTTLFSRSSDRNSRTWPFSFTLPTKFVTPHRKFFGKGATSGKEYSFPPCMQINQLPISLHYFIEVRADRGLLKLDHQLRTRLRYVPITYPSRPISTLRYGTPDLPHPLVDPKGFESTLTTLSGSLPNGKKIQIDCQLYLASPTEYPRGSFIPFFIKLYAPLTASCDQESQKQAVNILASNGSLKPHLTRVGITEHTFKGTITTIVASGKMWKLSYVEDKTPNEGPVHWLQGEIAIPKTALMNFVFPILRIKHLLGVVVDAPSIVLDSDSRSALDFLRLGHVISAPVVLTSARRPEDPQSVSYAPAPGYVQEE